MLYMQNDNLYENEPDVLIYTNENGEKEPYEYLGTVELRGRISYTFTF